MTAGIRAGNIFLQDPFVVFDKDGLMFQSQPFWQALGQERMTLLGKHISAELCERWARLFGFQVTDGVITHTDPLGIFAVAALAQETAVTAGFLTAHAGFDWKTACALADEIFEKADAQLDLRRALVPRAGFPEILVRLRAAGLRYAIASSDTAERVTDSLALFCEACPELVITPGRVKNQKPAPDMLLLIADAAGVPIDRIVMVGDSVVDTEMAKNAGAIGIGIPETEEMRRGMEPSASAILNSLDEITIIDSNGGQI